MIRYAQTEASVRRFSIDKVLCQAGGLRQITEMIWRRTPSIISNLPTKTVRLNSIP